MLQPKRTKYRKQMKGRVHGMAKGGTVLNFGTYGMKATSPGRITTGSATVLVTWLGRNQGRLTGCHNSNTHPLSS